MEEHREGQWTARLRRRVQGVCAVPVACLLLNAAYAQDATPRHFDLQAGNAAITLNEFSRQSDLQVLFDFNILKGMRTRAVTGELAPSQALRAMLEGTDLVFDFVNDRTLAVTPAPKKPSLLRRVLQHLTSGRTREPDEKLEQVLVLGATESGTALLVGAPTIELSRTDIDRSGLATVEDFLHTLPQVFGGGPSQDTVLGREAASNSARGSGINLRGLDASATLVLIDGRRVAPSGTQGAFDDVSNIPLGIIDHIDVLPDGNSAKYGADAVAGVVNFVTRRDFPGALTQARGGGVTNGSMPERQFSQLIGTTGDSSSAMLAFEYFQRDALRAQDRPQATNDLTPFGGSNFDSTTGSPGTIVSSDGGVWAIPKGQNGTALKLASLSPGVVNLYDQARGTDITPWQERWSLFGKESFTLTDHAGLFLEGLFTRRKVRELAAASEPLLLQVPASNPFYVNPTRVAGPVDVETGSSTYFGTPQADNRIDTGNFSLGLSAGGWRGWTVSAVLGLSFEKQHLVQLGQWNPATLAAALADPDPSTALNAFGDGANTNPATLAAISGDSRYESDSTLKTANLDASGPILRLRGGDLQGAVGAEYRIQDFATSITSPGETAGARSDLGRRVATTYAEFRAPLIGTDNALRFARRLELSLGLRHEHYSDVGDMNVPKVGLLWSLNDNLSLRSTWTRAFRPPNLSDLVAKDSYSTLLTVPDPTSPTGVSTVLGRYGTNPTLTPETARTWTVGADVGAPRVPGLSFSLSYFDIDYSRRIDDALLTPAILTEPAYTWLVNRNFTAAELNDACNHSVFVGSPGTCLTTPIAAIVDNRLRNLALLRTRGLDLLARYSVEAALPGKFVFGLNGTWLFDYSETNTPGAAPVNVVSTQNNPIDLRLRASGAWTWRGVSVSSFVNFENSYRDTLSVPNRGIASWTTLDLQLAFETGAAAPGWLGSVQFAFSAQNVFNIYPPFVNNPVGVGYDQENADLYGRLLSFDVRKRW